MKGRVPGRKWDEDIVRHRELLEKENDRKMRILRYRLSHNGESSKFSGEI